MTTHCFVILNLHYHLVKMCLMEILTSNVVDLTVLKETLYILSVCLGGWNLYQYYLQSLNIRFRSWLKLHYPQ